MPALSPRLAALASLVRPGAYAADIGSDHGYLPLYLLREGVVEKAVATDLREGPLRSARAHLAAEDPALAPRLTLLCTDGLTGLDGLLLPHLRTGVCDIVIAGMGGELIVSILEKAPWVRHPAIRLLLQPMTKQETVRRFLEENRFFTETELLAEEDGRIYQILAAGTPESGDEDESVPLPPMTALETLVGRRKFWTRADGTPDPLRPLLFARIRQRTLTALTGKQKAGIDPREEEALLRELEAVSGAISPDGAMAIAPAGTMDPPKNP